MEDHEAVTRLIVADHKRMRERHKILISDLKFKLKYGVIGFSFGVLVGVAYLGEKYIAMVTQ